MDALVNLQITRVTKSFVTLWTDIRFFSCVAALVYPQSIRATEGFHAQLTSVASGSFCWNLACPLDRCQGGSDWSLSGGCNVWQETRLQRDFSARQQSAVQLSMAPLHVSVEEDLRRVGVRTLRAGETLCWGQLGSPS